MKSFACNVGIGSEDYLMGSDQGMLLEGVCDVPKGPVLFPAKG